MDSEEGFSSHDRDIVTIGVLTPTLLSLAMLILSLSPSVSCSILLFYMKVFVSLSC